MVLRAESVSLRGKLQRAGQDADALRQEVLELQARWALNCNRVVCWAACLSHSPAQGVNPRHCFVHCQLVHIFCCCT